MGSYALKSFAVLAMSALWFGRLTAAEDAQRVALVIGCGQYRVSGNELPTPPLDAASVARLLASPQMGFAVVGGKAAGAPVIDPTRDDFFEALDAFKARARQARVALIYYSGHGIEEDGQNYLIPVDASLDSASQLRSQAVSLRSIMDDLGTTGAEAKVVILDCCRNNPFRATRSWARSRGFRDEVLAELGAAEIPEGTAVLFATGPGRKAADRLEDNAANSPFTTHLLRELSRPGQSALMAFSNIETLTGRDTSGRQIPRTQLSGSLGVFQSVVFIPSGTPPLTPPEETAPAAPSPQKIAPGDQPSSAAGTAHSTAPVHVGATPTPTPQTANRPANPHHHPEGKTNTAASNLKPKSNRKSADDSPASQSDSESSTHGSNSVRQGIETQYRRGQITHEQYVNALKNL